MGSIASWNKKKSITIFIFTETSQSNHIYHDEFVDSYLRWPPSRTCKQDTEESNDHHIAVLKKQQRPAEYKSTF